MTSQRQPPKQLTLFGPSIPSTLDVAGPNVPCDVVAIEKRRDGGTRYWCRAHRADATAKGGTMAARCRRADTVPIRTDETLTLDLDKYLGGVALWGAVPAVYDTTRQKLDRGIHIHTRLTLESPKDTDWTYRAVQLVRRGLPEEGVVVSELDAIYYMISSIFGFPMTFVTCTHCGWPHLDKDWFSVHPHRRHLCAGCGKHFYDRVTGIGNPIIGVRDALDVGEHKIVLAEKTLDINQSEYPGGIQIWGSNPAFLWTQPKPEKEGIHVHAFRTDGQAEPTLDDTFREVTIDGIRLDPVTVRVLMAQNVMPSLESRVRSMNCTNCGHSHFDLGEAAYVPLPRHTCSECGRQFRTPGRLRNVVANPLPAILAELSKLAPRPPQEHRLDLLPETL
jgi:transposase-like protein